MASIDRLVSVRIRIFFLQNFMELYGVAFSYAGIHSPILKSTKFFSEWVVDVRFSRSIIPVTPMHSLGHSYRDIVSDGFVQVCVCVMPLRALMVRAFP